VFFVISARSVEQTLPPGTPLHFCGLYLDCHLYATVLGTSSSPLPEGGVRYLVRVRLASDAKVATLRFTNPTARLVDDAGHSVPAVEGPGTLSLASRTGREVEFEFRTVTLLRNPRMLLRKGGRLERLSELLLVGDPDSFLHAPVTLGLEERGSGTGD